MTTCDGADAPCGAGGKMAHTKTEISDIETLSVYIDRLQAFGMAHPTKAQRTSIVNACVRIAVDVCEYENKAEKPIDKSKRRLVKRKR